MKKTCQNLAILLNQSFVQEFTCIDNYNHKSCFLVNCDEQNFSQGLVTSLITLEVKCLNSA